MVHVAAGRRRPTTSIRLLSSSHRRGTVGGISHHLPIPRFGVHWPPLPLCIGPPPPAALSYCVLRLKEIPAPRSFMPSKQRLPSSLLPTTERQRTALLHGLLWIVTVSAVSFLLGDAPVEAISYGAFSGILYGIVVYVWQPY